MSAMISDRRRLLGAAAFALGLLLAAYSHSLHNGFHFDDFHTITDNPAVRSLHNIPRFFTDATTFSVLPANRTYRPLVSASLALDYYMGHGYVPVWFHVSTAIVYLLQLGSMWILFASIGRRFVERTQAAWIALGATAWYGVHPAMAETVNYIIQRGDIYATCGVVGALALFACRPGWRRFGLYLLPFALALLSKPPAVVFPVLVFAFVAMFEETGPGRWKRAAVSAAPSLAVGVALMLLQSAMTPKTFAPSTISTADYILTQPFVLLRAFGSMVLPVHLNVDSDLGAFSGLTSNALWGILFLLCVLGAIALMVRRRQWHPAAFGLIWFVVCSLPTSLYRLSEVENDHRMFLPFVGLIFAAVWTIAMLYARVADRLTRGWRTGLVVMATLLLCCYAYGAYARNAVWASEETLWRDDVQKSPHNGRGLMIYGLTQMNKGAYPAALAAFQESLQYTPNYDTLEVNLGVVTAAMGDGVAAEQHFRRAITLAPNDDQAHVFYARFLLGMMRLTDARREAGAAVTLNPARVAGRDELIQVLQMSGDTAGAQALARETLAIAPDDVQARQALVAQPGMSAAAWINASLARYQMQDYKGCIEASEKALALDPGAAAAYINIGAAEAGLAQWSEAVKAEQQALRLDPSSQLAKNNLNAYAAAASAGVKSSSNLVAETPEQLLNRSLEAYQLKQFKPSVELARHAIQLRPNYAEAWNNVAAGEAAQAHWDAAIVAATRAVALKPDFQLAKNNLAWAQAEKTKGAAR